MVKMTRNEAVGLNIMLRSFEGKTVGCEFDYARGKNLRKLKPEMEEINEARSPLQAIEEERMALCKEHCAKNEDGTPKLKDNVFEGLEGNAAFEAAFEVIKAKVTDLEKLLTSLGEEEVEIDSHCLTLDKFPKEGPAGYMDALAPMVKE